MNKSWYVAIFLSLTLQQFSSAQEEQRSRLKPAVIPVILSMQNLLDSGIEVGHEAWLSVEYLSGPEGEVLFEEPGEKLWWIGSAPVLMLGGSGMPLPDEVLSRQTIWVNFFEGSHALRRQATLLYPKRDRIHVTADGEKMKSNLKRALGGVHAGHLAQVSNFLSGNTVELNIIGTSFELDGYGTVVDQDKNIYGNRISGFSDDDYAVAGLSSDSTNGRGLQGIAVASTGTNSGVLGLSYSDEGRGVSGQGNTGIWGQGDLHGVFGTGHYGVRGETDEASGIGVFGISYQNSGLTTGTYGATYSPEGRGLAGFSYSGSGTTYGVYGQASSSQGFGVFGKALSTHSSHWSSGVWGEANANYGVGVYGVGRGASSKGVIGTTFGTNLNCRGVWGIWAGSVTGYAGYFDGHVRVTNNLIVDGNLVGGKIMQRNDHPNDPLNRYLDHFGVSSSDELHLYSGNVILDSVGEATIQLPEWFCAANRDFRYTLTCIGSHANVFIAKEIEGNSFTIGGGTPNQKVSWQVTALAGGPQQKMQSPAIAVDKPEHERGTYLQPERFGETIDKSYASKSLEQAKRELEAQMPRKVAASVAIPPLGPAQK